MSSTDPHPHAPRRLDQLDGLRGIAALSVVVFHYTTRWAEPSVAPIIYPFGSYFRDTFPFLGEAGIFGVQLFFVTSGFVILMTLERSSGLLEFGVRRMARLWPGMLVCATLSALIINASGFADRVPHLARFEVTWLEYVSSIFFISPQLVSDVIGGPPSHWVEGVYWTLFAEVRFYVLIVLVWLLAGSKNFMPVWLVVQAFSLGLATGLVPKTGIAAGDLILSLTFQPNHLIWFTMGLLAYRAWTRNMGVSEYAMIALSVLALLFAEPLDRLITHIAILVVFSLALIPGPWMKPLSWKPLLTIGLASYPLYLFHERTGTILLHDLGAMGVPSWILLPVITAGAIVVSVLIHRRIEEPSRHFIRRKLEPWAQSQEAKWPALKFRDRAAPS